jgi:hypothetical protein
MMIRVTRDSVCMADDMYGSPYREELQCAATDSLRALLDHVRSREYLPSISGGKATWVVTVGPRHRHTVAVVTQQKSFGARFLIDPEATVGGLAEDPDVLEIHFGYRAQEDPQHVYATLAPNSTR